MRKDLVFHAALFLECSPLFIFAISTVYASKKATREKAEAELLEWRKTGKYQRQVEDFCLDLLSKRITAKIDFRALEPIKLRSAE